MSASASFFSCNSLPFESKKINKNLSVFVDFPLLYALALDSVHQRDAAGVAAALKRGGEERLD
ncbi:MAG: hypothetical protein ACM678_05135, partial [Clostridiales bacterium]